MKSFEESFPSHACAAEGRRLVILVKVAHEFEMETLE